MFHADAAQSELSAREIRILTWDELHHEDYEGLFTVPNTPNFHWYSVVGDVAPHALSRAISRTILILGPSMCLYIHPREGRTDSPMYLYLEKGHYWELCPKEALLAWEDDFYGC